MRACPDLLHSAVFAIVLFPLCSSLHSMHENRWNTFYEEEQEFDWTHAGNGTIEQILDHFGEDQATTFRQRYLYNHTFANDSGIVLLNLCGEWTCDEWDFRGITNFAEYFGAQMYALEHRYYGMSFPHGRNDTAFPYLSSRQALEDAAYFIQKINAESKTSLRWIVFGCSYAGMLSLWFRQQHPELVIGAVGSSAPIRAVLDFYGYIEAIEEYVRNYGEYNEGRKCYDSVLEGFRSIREAEVSEWKRNKFERIMNESMARLNVTKHGVLPAMINANDFLIQMVRLFALNAQYGGSNATIMACEAVYRVGIDLEDAKAISKATIDAIENLNLTIRNESHISPHPYSWSFQKCTEFGFYKTTNFGTGLFGTIRAMEKHIIKQWDSVSECMELFNITVNEIEKSVQKTNEFYGGTEDYKGTNVVITYGTVDPWSRLVKKTANHPSVTIVEMPGAHHCGDRHMDIGAPPNALIIKNIEQWLKEKPQKIPVDTPKEEHQPQGRPIYGIFGAAVIQLEQEHECSFLPSPCSGRVMQPIDHFDEYNKDEFRQRFFLNSEFGKQDGPNILYIAGEYEATEEMVWNSKKWFHVDIGKKHGANIFVLEHRYFGHSYPSTTDLEYLTTAQALFDVATFINSMKEEAGTTGEWIVFGRGYSGALAAWARQWFPDLIYGAYAISPALEAKLNFYEHIQFVDDLLRNESCYSRLKEAFSEMHWLFKNEQGRRKLSDLLRLEPRWYNASPETEDLQLVFRTISAELGIASGLLHSIGLPLVETCKAMENSSSNTSELITLSNLLETKNITSVPSSLKQHYATAKQALRYSGTKIYFRDRTTKSLLWQYLQCNELGFFQTTDYNEGIFGDALPVNLYLLMCENIFGLGVDHVTTAVERTNRRYGGRRHFNASNVALYNGYFDPWNELGISPDDDSSNDFRVDIEPTPSGAPYDSIETTSKNHGLKERVAALSSWPGKK